MSAHFAAVDPTDVADNPFKLIGADWMLITAGTSSSFNMMTASWGGLGVLWQRNVCFCFIRPTRHTYGFMEREPGFTLSFFEERYRKALNICGSRSGRDIDKVAETGLTPRILDGGGVTFEEARLVFACRRLYFQDLMPSQFLDPALESFYPDRDYHRMYVGEILECLLRRV